MNPEPITAPPADVWANQPTKALVDHIVTRFHERHRVQLPELIRQARRVEMVHAGKPGCPSGLADALEGLQQELESHMLKEEQMLFPLLVQGVDALAQGPVRVMRFEHDHQDETLDHIYCITSGITEPEGACNTWRALYGGLRTFARDLTEHIALENDVLFSRISKGVEGAQDA